MTLFIGNRNAKGVGAVASALADGFADPGPVDLPVGRPIAYRAESPDAALWADRNLSVEFRVAFERGLAGRLMGALGPLAGRLENRGRTRLARLLALASSPVSHFGSPLGCLHAELWSTEGDRISASLLGTGQRLAILPCAIALEALVAGELRERGLVDPTAWLSPDEWIERVRARGIEFQGARKPR